MAGDDDWLDDDAEEEKEKSESKAEKESYEFEDYEEDDDGNIIKREKKEKPPVIVRPKLLQLEGKIIVVQKDAKGVATQLALEVGKEKYLFNMNGMAEQLKKYVGRFLMVSLLEAPSDGGKPHYDVRSFL